MVYAVLCFFLGIFGLISPFISTDVLESLPLTVISEIIGIISFVDFYLLGFTSAKSRVFYYQITLMFVCALWDYLFETLQKSFGLSGSIVTLAVLLLVSLIFLFRLEGKFQYNERRNKSLFR